MQSGENFTASGFNPATTGDVVFFNNGGTLLSPVYALNDVFTLSAGTFTTTNSYSGALPSDGTYSTFIATDDGRNLSGAGAVPEPSTYAVFAGLGVLGFAAWRRRRSVTAQVAA